MNASITLPLSELERAIKVLTQRPMRDLVGDRKLLTVVFGDNLLELSYAGALTRLSGTGGGNCRALAPFNLFTAALYKQRRVSDGNVEVSADEHSVRIGDFGFTPEWIGPPESGTTFGAGLIPEPNDALDLQVAFDVYPFAELEANGLDRLALDATNEAKSAVESALTKLSVHGLDSHGLLEALGDAKQARFQQWQVMGCAAADPYAETAEVAADDTSYQACPQVIDTQASGWQETRLRRPSPVGVDGQGHLFQESFAALKQRLGIDEAQLARWHDLGWLNSSLEQEEHCEAIPWVGVEVEFIHSLAELGFDDMWITELLEGLDRPYSYRYQQMLLQLPGTWWRSCPSEEAVAAWWEFLGSHLDSITNADAAEGQAGAVVELLGCLVPSDAD
jgi:hypothetical protein